MQNFNAAVGGSEAIINSTLERLYELLKPTLLFSHSFPVDSIGIGNVDIEIAQAPTVTLKASVPSAIKDEVIKEAKSVEGSPSDTALNQTLSLVAKSTLKLNFPVIKVRLHYTDPSAEQSVEDVTASLVAIAGMQVDMTMSPPSATLKAISGKATTDAKALDGILNNAIIPRFLPTLNKEVLDLVRIPTIKELPGVDLSAPATAVTDGFIVAYSALGPFPPAVPEKSIGWPGHGVFAYADADFLAAATRRPLQEQSILATKFTAGPFYGTYSVDLDGLRNVSIGGDGSVSAEAPLSGVVSVTFNHGLPFIPKPSFRLRAYGIAGVTARGGINHQTVWGLIQSINQLTFDLNVGEGGKPWAGLGPIESLTDSAIGNLRVALVDSIVRPKLDEVLVSKQFAITTVPPIEINLGSKKHNIGIDNVQFSGDNSTGHAYLVANAGQPAIW
ncbi:MAG: hypothetical protein Q9165_007029 [Trypethelium subeluteriae]